MIHKRKILAKTISQLSSSIRILACNLHPVHIFSDSTGFSSPFPPAISHTPKSLFQASHNHQLKLPSTKSASSTKTTSSQDFLSQLLFHQLFRPRGRYPCSCETLRAALAHVNSNHPKLWQTPFLADAVISVFVFDFVGGKVSGDL